MDHLTIGNSRRILYVMSPYQTACLFLLTAGLCMVVLLLMPVAHASLIVIHGPMTALRSFRFAAFFRWLLQASLLLLAAILPPRLLFRSFLAEASFTKAGLSVYTLNSPLRC